MRLTDYFDENLPLPGRETTDKLLHVGTFRFTCLIRDYESTDDAAKQRISVGMVQNK